MPAPKKSARLLPLSVLFVFITLLVLAACGETANLPVQTKPLPTLAPTNTPVPAAPLISLNRDDLLRTSVTASLLGSGSTFAAPIYAAWFEQFRRTSPNVKIEYQAIGSGNGRRSLLGTPVAAVGTLTPTVPNDFAGSDAPFLSSELLAASQKGQLLHIPTAVGAVVVAYNLKEAPRLKLSGPLLADIFLGKITRWNDPRIQSENTEIQLPDRELRPVVRGKNESSGTSEIFTRYLSVVSDDFRSAVGPGGQPKWTLKTTADNGRALEGQGNDGMADQILKNEGSIGYVDQGVADDKKITYALVRNKTGRFIYPERESVSAAAAGAFIPDDFRTFIVDAEGANTYPIVGFTWLIVWRDLNLMPNPSPDKARAMATFLWWALHDGQRSLPAGYAALPEALIPRLERLFIPASANQTDRVLLFQGKPLVSK